MKMTVPVLVLLLLAPAVIASPKVIISEIMYDPTMGADYDYEWIELYNPNNADVDVSGWRVEDADGGGYTLPDGTIIGPGKYLVVARDAVKVKSYYSTDKNFDATAVYGDATFTLNNDGDTIFLKDEQGNVVDQVQYFPDWGAKGNGKTLERKAPLGSSNDELNWGESMKDGGTPTYVNTVYVPFFSAPVAVILTLALGVVLLGRR